MYTRLTRLDGSPIWINASFVVTVEPRKGGGSIVVPIGDGLDYDVRETPEAVLALLEGAPVPAVVPVPVSDCLTKTPEDVSPDSPPRPGRDAEPRAIDMAIEEESEAKAERARRRTSGMRKAKAESDAEPKASQVSKSKADEAPDEGAVKTDAKSPAVKASAVDEGAPPDENDVLKSRPSDVPGLTDELLARLAKMAPKSLVKLKNTLVKQFKVGDVDTTVAMLVEKGYITHDGKRVTWGMSLADW